MIEFFGSMELIVVLLFAVCCIPFIESKCLCSFLSVAVITCASHAQGRRFEPGRKQIFSFCSVSTIMFWSVNKATSPTIGFHGVMVSTLDFESSDPSSNLGGTLTFFA